MAVQSANKLLRTKKGKKIQDISSIPDLQYNEASGGQKNMTVGPHLNPLKSGAATFTTDATTIRALKLGSALAIYNNAGAVGSVRFSNDPGATSLAPGVVDAGTGDVGVPCPPNSWTYLSNYDKRYIIASAATLLVFEIQDDTKVINEDPNQA